MSPPTVLDSPPSPSSQSKIKQSQIKRDPNAPSSPSYPRTSNSIDGSQPPSPVPLTSLPRLGSTVGLEFFKIDTMRQRLPCLSIYVLDLLKPLGYKEHKVISLCFPYIHFHHIVFVLWMVKGSGRSLGLATVLDLRKAKLLSSKEFRLPRWMQVAQHESDVSLWKYLFPTYRDFSVRPKLNQSHHLTVLLSGRGIFWAGAGFIFLFSLSEYIDDGRGLDSRVDLVWWSDMDKRSESSFVKLKWITCSCPCKYEIPGGREDTCSGISLPPLPPSPSIKGFYEFVIFGTLCGSLLSLRLSPSHQPLAVVNVSYRDNVCNWQPPENTRPIITECSRNGVATLAPESNKRRRIGFVSISPSLCSTSGYHSITIITFKGDVIFGRGVGDGCIMRYEEISRDKVKRLRKESSQDMVQFTCATSTKIRGFHIMVDVLGSGILFMNVETGAIVGCSTVKNR